MDFISRNPLSSIIFGGGILGFNILYFRGLRANKIHSKQKQFIFYIN